MRRRDRDRNEWESFDPVVWPADDDERDGIAVDDEAFARAIAEGRRATTAA